MKHSRGDVNAIENEVKRLRKKVASLEKHIRELQSELEELREAEALYSTLVEQAMESVIIIQYGQVKFANKAHEQLTGFSREEMMRMPWEDMLTPEASRKARERYEARKRGVRLNPITTTTLQCKDGALRELEVTTVDIQFRGKPATMAIMRDVTERLIAERALRESEASLKQAQKLAHVGSWEWNLETGALKISEEMARIYGKDNDSSFDNIFDFITSSVYPEDKTLLHVLTEKFPELKHTEPITYRIVRPDGDVRWLLTSLPEVLEIDPEGKPRVIAGTVQDITERKQAEEELRALLASMEEQNRVITQSHRELQEALDKLQQAQDELKASQAQLLQSEKLAAVGQLVSGLPMN